MAKKKKSSFRGKIKKDVARQKLESSSFGYLMLPKDIKVYKPTPGTREKFDIIPYTVSDKKHADRDEESEIALEDTLWYKRPFKVHRQVGADNDTMVCLTTFGKKCPICDYRKQRAKDGADVDELKAYKQSKRNLYAVIPIGIKKLEEVIHIFDFSQFLFQDLLNEETEEDEDYEIFPDLEEGFTLKVRWNEESFAKNTFAEAGRIDFVKRKAYKESILKDVPDLDKLLKELSYDELSAKFHEMEEDEDNHHKKKSNKKKKSKKKVDLTWGDIIDMGMPELYEVIDAYKLKLAIDQDVSSTQELQEAIANELNIKITKKKKTNKESKNPNLKKDSKNKCPEGFKYGVDTDNEKITKGKCDSCELWDNCIDKKEE